MLEQVLSEKGVGSVGLETQKVELVKGQILRDVIPFKTETTSTGREVFVFQPSGYNAKGLIFPNDERIYPGTPYDVVVNGIIPKGRGALLMSEVHYEVEVEDVLQIRISRISPQGDGIFKLNGYLGFVKKGEEEIKVGDGMPVQVTEIYPSKHKGMRILNTVPK